jgi:hypothetical protein
MSEEPERRQYGEKEEKPGERDEKQEKQHEKEEKSWEEKWRRDPLSAAVWAIILIWAGLVFLASNLDLLAGLGGQEAWGLIVLGAAVILFLEILFRQLVPAYRQPVLGTAIIAIVFLAIGLGSFLETGVIWALAIIAAGVYILYRGLFRRRE